MKLLLAFLGTLAIAGSPGACNKVKTPTCYKGRLEVRGICGNYTIALLEGDLEGIQPSWTDEQTGKTYKDVFRPANACNIPDSIRQGDTFYFKLDTAQNEDCTVCMAYYPAPEKKIGIRLTQGASGAIK